MGPPAARAVCRGVTGAGHGWHAVQLNVFVFLHQFRLDALGFLAGQRPLLVHDSAQNVKITYPEDFALAQAVLQARAS